MLLGSFAASGTSTHLPRMSHRITRKECCTLTLNINNMLNASGHMYEFIHEFHCMPIGAYIMKKGLPNSPSSRAEPHEKAKCCRTLCSEHVLSQRLPGAWQSYVIGGVRRNNERLEKRPGTAPLSAPP